MIFKDRPRLNTIYSVAGLIVTLVVMLAAAVWWLWMPSPVEPGYTFVTAWGGPGTGTGQFSDPTGIAVYRNEVFVSDARNARIQVFDLAGHFLRQFGTKGKGPGQLGRPMNLTVAGGELYVADYWNDRIAVFGLDGAPRHTLGHAGEGPGQFQSPGGVAVAPRGDLYVAEFYGQRIQQLSAQGTFVRQWGRTGEKGVTPGHFNYPTDVALAPDGALYVADGYNDRIQVFNNKGGFLRKWGGPLGMNISGPFNGWFSTVTGIALDGGGNLFAADFHNHRVQKFSSDGRFLTAFGRRGAGPGEFTLPIAVAVAGDGSVFVTDFGNNRIQKWRPIRP